MVVDDLEVHAVKFVQRFVGWYTTGVSTVQRIQ